jgi:serine protease Do
LTLQPLTDQLAEFLGVTGKKGAMVTAVTDGSPSAGKLKAGDVIIRAEDKSIVGPEDVARAISGKEGKLTLAVIRDKKEISVTVELPKVESGSSRGGYRL